MNPPHADTVVYLTIRLLPEHHRPVFIHRQDGKTIAAVDPRETRITLTMAMIDALEPDELNALRAAFGLLPVGHGPAPDHWTDDLPCLLYVPPSMRLSGAAAIQGGAMLDARIEVGALPYEEILMLQAEPPSLARSRELAHWAAVQNKVLRRQRAERLLAASPMS